LSAFTLPGLRVLLREYDRVRGEDQVFLAEAVSAGIARALAAKGSDGGFGEWAKGKLGDGR
jgi:hypothetical protein